MTMTDDVDNHPLDKESAMEAIRYNGYVPEADGHWITFMAQGEHYAIDADRFPVMVMRFTGEEEDGIMFQITRTNLSQLVPT